MTEILTHAEYQAIAAELSLPCNAFIDGKFQPAKSKKSFATINRVFRNDLELVFDGHFRVQFDLGHVLAETLHRSVQVDLLLLQLDAIFGNPLDQFKGCH